MQGPALIPAEIAASLSSAVSRLEVQGVPALEAIKTVAREHNASFHRVAVLIMDHRQAHRQKEQVI